MASTIECFLGPGLALQDEFVLEFEVGGGEGSGEGGAAAAFSVPVCYQHVEAVDDLALCTQPHYNFSAHGAYFTGSPPYPHGTTLVDAFLLYHSAVVASPEAAAAQQRRLSIVFQDLDGSFAPAVSRHAATPGVRYRPGWELTPGLHTTPGLMTELEHQSFAESSCFWEQRISARWVMQALSVDCYLLPAARGVGVLGALAGVDPSAYAELSVTAVQGFSPPNSGTASSSGNVLQRYPLVDGDFATEFWRTMPIGNPRLHTYGMVHWLEYGKRPEVQLPVMSEREVLGKVGLQVLRVVAFPARATTQVRMRACAHAHA
jgi:hypothetical protein